MSGGVVWGGEDESEDGGGDEEGSESGGDEKDEGGEVEVGNKVCEDKGGLFKVGEV